MGIGMTCASSKTQLAQTSATGAAEGFAPVGETPLKGGSHRQLAHAPSPEAELAQPWHPIASIPAERREASEVPLWAGRLVVGTWCDGWCDPVGRPIAGVTHYAEIEGPAL